MIIWRESILELFPTIPTYQNPINMNPGPVLCKVSSAVRETAMTKRTPHVADIQIVCSFVCLMCTRVQASGLMPCARWNRKPRHSRHRRPNDQGHRCHCEKRQNYTPCHAPKKCATIKIQTCTRHQWALFMSAFKYTLNASWAAAWLTGNTLEPECVESYSIHINAPTWYFVPIEWN